MQRGEEMSNGSDVVGGEVWAWAGLEVRAAAASNPPPWQNTVEDPSGTV